VGNNIKCHCNVYFQSPALSQTDLPFSGIVTKNSLVDKYLDLAQPQDAVMCEYVWIDGTDEGIRSKCKTMTTEPKVPAGTNIDYKLVLLPLVVAL
jgi:hypothetical protein